MFKEAKSPPESYEIPQAIILKSPETAFSVIKRHQPIQQITSYTTSIPASVPFVSVFVRHTQHCHLLHHSSKSIHSHAVALYAHISRDIPSVIFAVYCTVSFSIIHDRDSWLSKVNACLLTGRLVQREIHFIPLPRFNRTENNSSKTSCGMKIPNLARKLPAWDFLHLYLYHWCSPLIR